MSIFSLWAQLRSISFAILDLCGKLTTGDIPFSWKILDGAENDSPKSATVSDSVLLEEKFISSIGRPNDWVGG